MYYAQDGHVEYLLAVSRESVKLYVHEVFSEKRTYPINTMEYTWLGFKSHNSNLQLLR